MKRAALVLWSVAVGVLACGCADVCDEACDVEIDRVDDCLEEWGASWADFDYEGRDEALDLCKRRYADAIKDEQRSRSSGAVETVRNSCSTLVDDLAEAATCDQVLQASGR
jgi:hypothetical protein